MYTIVTDTIADAHEKVVRLILQGKDFNDILTEDKEQTLEYPEPVNIHVNDPFRQPMTSPKLMFGQQAMDAYKDQVLKPRRLVDKPGKPDFSYLYSNLIWDFPRDHQINIYDTDTKKLIRSDWYRGNGRMDGINQIDYVVKKLTETPTSRRAVVSLFEPQGHEIMDDPPCLNHIQFLLRNGHLNMHALFRSNDMLSAWGANAFALAHLQKEVLVRVNAANVNKAMEEKSKELIKDVQLMQMGFLETTSISAHIYFKRDHSEAEKFRGFY
jgi:thymidylate synthase